MLTASDDARDPVSAVALALASQKTFENLFGAFSLGVDQPFREGDFVRVEDVVGTVESLGLRSTKIRTLDRTIVSIALAADASWLSSLLLSYILQYAPSSRLAIQAPRPRSSTDLTIRGPLAHP